MNCGDEVLEFARNAFYLKGKINEKIAKESFLSPIDVEILTFIYVFPNDKATASDIERERNIKKNTISIHIENLVQMGLLERREREGDRRKVTLALTDKAVPIARRCLGERESLGEKMREGLTQDEIETMRHCIDVGMRNMQKMAAKWRDK